MVAAGIKENGTLPNNLADKVKMQHWISATCANQLPSLTWLKVGLRQL